MNRLELVRSVYGLGLVIAPRLLAKPVMGASITRGAVAVIRILGARHFVQGLATISMDSHRIRHLGGAVDVLHSLSMVGVGIFVVSHRRAAFADAAIAGAFATSEFSRG